MSKLDMATINTMTLAFAPSIPSLPKFSRTKRFQCSTPRCTLAVPATLDWGVRIPATLQTTVLNESPPLIQLHSFLTPAECQALIDSQRTSKGPERDNYLNFDAGAGNGYRQGVAMEESALSPVRAYLNNFFPQRRHIFAEELWHRPRRDTIVIRDATTVRYFPGEGVSSHVDGKDVTLLVYLKPADSGGATIFDNLGPKRCSLRAGDALIYESKHALTHHAERVTEGEKWVLQLLIDYKVRADD